MCSAAGCPHTVGLLRERPVQLRLDKFRLHSAPEAVLVANLAVDLDRSVVDVHQPGVVLWRSLPARSSHNP